MTNIDMQERASFQTFLDEQYANRLLSSHERVSRDQILADGIIVYGIAGLGKQIVTSLLSKGVTPSWIVDRDETLEGTDFLGVPVRPVSSLADTGGRFVLLASTHVQEMSAECRNYDVKKWILPASIRDFCSFLGEIGICNTAERHDDALLAGYALMADQKSRDIYRAFVRYHHTFDNDFAPFHDPHAYFPEDLASKINYSTFVDVGAFTGDTLSDWIAFFSPANSDCRYYAFEPDLSSFQMLMEYVNSLPPSVHEKIRPYNLALGADEGWMDFVGSYGDSFADQDKGQYGQVQCTKIDTFFKGICPSIIKADV